MFEQYLLQQRACDQLYERGDEIIKYLGISEKDKDAVEKLEEIDRNKGQNPEQDKKMEELKEVLLQIQQVKENQRAIVGKYNTQKSKRLPPKGMR